MFWCDPVDGDMSVSVASGDLISFPEEVHKQYSWRINCAAAYHAVTLLVGKCKRMNASRNTLEAFNYQNHLLLFHLLLSKKQQGKKKKKSAKILQGNQKRFRCVLWLMFHAC